MHNSVSSKGAILIFFDSNIRYKVRNNLKMFKSKKIEPTFITIIKTK